LGEKMGRGGKIGEKVWGRDKMLSRGVKLAETSRGLQKNGWGGITLGTRLGKFGGKLGKKLGS